MKHIVNIVMSRMAVNGEYQHLNALLYHMHMDQKDDDEEESE